MAGNHELNTQADLATGDPLPDKCHVALMTVRCSHVTHIHGTKEATSDTIDPA